MQDINRVSLSGVVESEPQVKFFPWGAALDFMLLSVEEPRKTLQGQSKTFLFPISVVGNQEYITDLQIRVQRGRYAVIEGRLFAQAARFFTVRANTVIVLDLPSDSQVTPHVETQVSPQSQGVELIQEKEDKKANWLLEIKAQEAQEMQKNQLQDLQKDEERDRIIEHGVLAGYRESDFPF